MIPPELFKLTNLRELYLCDNEITEIPPELYQLNKLNNLNLTNNKITKVKFDKTITNFLSKIYELKIDITSYDMANLDIDCNILIFTRICMNNHLINLPHNIKAICFSEKVENHYTVKNIDYIEEYNIKINLPLGCEIIYF
jgi:Leucine-rich repeat (LRR) protein